MSVRRLVTGALMIALLSISSTPGFSRGVDILDRVQALPGVISVVERTSSVAGARFFSIEFSQLVDHEHPEIGTFVQRVTLLHRSESRPTVLGTEGYTVAFTSARQTELTAIFQANQLNVEHRYFPPSIPSSPDWQYLNIQQSAGDHHAIVTAFKAIYTGKWVATGASKGGMASVYYRYFYPEDVDATVPYVAPNSHGKQDPSYIPFVASSGSKACSKKLRVFQKTALKKRAELEQMMSGSYSILGKDRAFEFAVIELPFIFWQYESSLACADIPGPSASNQAIYGFLDQVADVDSYGDGFLNFFGPWFYQASTQLGYPGIGDKGIRKLLLFPGEDDPAILPPLGVPKVYDPSVIPPIESWVLASGQRFLFIYGENDPWSTNAFQAASANDSFRFYVTGPNGNHSSHILTLSPQDQETALSRLEDWLDTPAARGIEMRASADSRFRIDYPTRQDLFLR